MVKRKFYYIDISRCAANIKDQFSPLELIPVVDGSFNSDFDILEDEIPPSLCNWIRHESKDAKKHRERMATLYHDSEELLEEALNDTDFMPVGVSRKSFPCGAVLVDR